jgi:hypothetical protein
VQDNTLVLLSSTRVTATVRSAAASVLQRLLHGLRNSLALAADLELADSAVAARIRSAVATAEGPEHTTTTTSSSSSWLRSSGYHMQLQQQQQGHGQGVAVDVTCPSSYPPLQPPPAAPADAVWQLLPPQDGGVVNVSAAVQLILMQVNK